MAPANAKPWKQQLLIQVAALLLLGLLLPVSGSVPSMREACYRGLSEVRYFSPQPPTCLRSLFGSIGFVRASTSEEDVRKCCGTIDTVISQSSKFQDCGCSFQKAFAQRKIDIDRVCELRTKEYCQAVEDAEKAREDAEKAAQRREDELSKLGACDRFFERLAAGELSKISRDNDIMACRQEMKTCPATCQVQQL